MDKVFIDGSSGTTGLRIRERISARDGIELVVLDETSRKDPVARKAAMESADVAFLCLPDAAAAEAVAMCETPDVVIIDTSTAHRTASGWEYGFPELPGRRERIARSTRIANPGCHASGFIALVEPLVADGILRPDAALAAFSLTGYSGGGKKMIAEYEGGGEISALYSGGRQYALGQTHKHLPEMTAICGLSRPPVFSPVVVPHYSGMEVTVALFADMACGGLEAVKSSYRERYDISRGGVVRFADGVTEDGFLSSAALSGSDAMEVAAFGNDERIILVSRFDNLGKGASGAAVQNMNLVLGRPETEGLALG